MGRALVLLLWLVAVSSANAGEVAVPDWFQPEPANPYGVFDKWRRLDSKEAALYLGTRWSVCGGELRDEEGAPIGNCPLGISYLSEIRGYSATLKTDTKGRFIIYSPYRGMPLNLERVRFRAAPGYPFSHMAMRFAGANGDWRNCKVRLAQMSADICFCYLTGSRSARYDGKAFREYVAAETAQWKKEKTKPFRAKPRAREGPINRGIRNEYRVRVVSPDGAPIPNVVLRFMAYDGFEGNQQTVVTDRNGVCILTEELLADRGKEYRSGIIRSLTLDVPGYWVGPVSHDLKTTEVNRITVQPGASISGTLTDWNGNAFRQRISVEYRKRNHVSFELSVYPAPDGTFTIDRIAPGEPFRLHASRASHQITSSAEVYSDERVLEAGEAKDRVNLRVPQAAAIRGVVVDEEGRPVTDIGPLIFQNEYRRWQHGEPTDGRFGTFGAPPKPLRITVVANGYEHYTSPEIPLEPGELRFVRVVMKKKSRKAQ